MAAKRCAFLTYLGRQNKKKESSSPTETYNGSDKFKEQWQVSTSLSDLMKSMESDSNIETDHAYSITDSAYYNSQQDPDPNVLDINKNKAATYLTQVDNLSEYIILDISNAKWNDKTEHIQVVTDTLKSVNHNNYTLNHSENTNVPDTLVENDKKRSEDKQNIKESCFDDNDPYDFEVEEALNNGNNNNYVLHPRQTTNSSPDIVISPSVESCSTTYDGFIDSDIDAEYRPEDSRSTKSTPNSKLVTNSNDSIFKKVANMVSNTSNSKSEDKTQQIQEGTNILRSVNHNNHTLNHYENTNVSDTLAEGDKQKFEDKQNIKERWLDDNDPYDYEIEETLNNSYNKYVLRPRKTINSPNIAISPSIESCSTTHDGFIDSDIDVEYRPEDSSSTEDLAQKSSNGEISSQNNTRTLQATSSPYQAGNSEPQVEVALKKNYKDRRDYCKFCDKDVSHFARHVLTWHTGELQVQKIMAYQKNSTKRRLALSELRKEGNFIRNRGELALRPVKRIKSGTQALPEDFLPCTYCLGFYKKKFLYRHTKICKSNPDLGKKNKRQCAQSDGQTLLLLNNTFRHHQFLKTYIFPKMRADEISYIAKQDPLICFFGYSYFKGRRSKGNLDSVRQNIRRLAKILKFAREQNNAIKEFLDLLKPEYFNIILDGVNFITGYDVDQDQYKSPKLASYFGTLIKKMCTLAITHLLQKTNTNTRREEIKTLNMLIDAQWANEISAQALTNLNEKRWNKDELLPLTTDLKIFNDFLKNAAHTNFNNLSVNESDRKAYNQLREILYCQCILLNRRRPGEVAQIKLKTYRTVNLDLQFSQKNEFEKCLTQTEKILLKTFNRIVIRGKRGRGVPVLLSPDMRKHFDLIVNVRNNFVVEGNDYVFHTSGEGCFDGTKILRKYVEKCDLQRPNSISTIGLRKHLATIAQLLNFSKNDLEQLSKFMGHTLKTHCDVYRISDNLYQTAKVSKLLLLMSEDGVSQFKGKQLDEIDIDLEPITENINFTEENEHTVDLNDSDSELSLSSETLKEKLPNCDDDSNEAEMPTVKIKKVRKCTNKVSWSSEQKNKISEYFKEHISKKQAPKKHEIEKFVNLHSNLMMSRKWTSIKAVVYNMYTKKLRFDGQVE